jgi:Na+/melibiose symporter-like transporter
MGLYFVVAAIPGILLGSIAGVFVDRWDRKWILVATSLALAPVYCLLFLVNAPEQVWITYVVALVGNIIRQLSNPAESALLPKLVGEGDLVTANALNSLNNNLARLIGPAVGGVVFALFGFHMSVLLDVASFVIGAVLIAMISAPRSVTKATPAEGEEAHAQQTPNIFREWIAGLKLIIQNSMLARILFLATMIWLADGAITVLFAVYVTDALHGGSMELGWLMTAQAIGGLIGSAFIGRVSKKVQAWQLVAWGLLVFGVIDVLIFAIPILPLNLALLVLIGAPLVGLDVGALTLLQVLTPDRYRGRVFGAVGTSQALLLLVGRGLATAFGGQVPVVPFMISMSVLVIISGILAFFLLRDPSQVTLSQMQREESETPAAA